ncbi:hypothetical protein ACFYTF_05725 [Nocardia thailandica]|uniref:Uncharacterized protein n=1 Tax=Nocardia thailandica TaxID=257275 RepID=A0ABW6PIX8_9NOCA
MGRHRRRGAQGSGGVAVTDSGRHRVRCFES